MRESWTADLSRASLIQREIEADELADETLEVADTCELTEEAVTEASAKIRDLQRQAAELAPWKYGDNPTGSLLG